MRDKLQRLIPWSKIECDNVVKLGFCIRGVIGQAYHLFKFFQAHKEGFSGLTGI